MDSLHPLSEFYQESGLPLPQVRQVAPHEIPEIYRRLLVHERDMTPTLEAAYRQSIRLRTLKYVLRGDVVSRQVLLVLEDDDTAVEFGAIKIHLGPFPEEARRLVVERKKPLGTILRLGGIVHECRPRGYFEVTVDPLIAEALDVERGSLLYGRQNVIWDSSGRALAEVLEILPPSDPSSNGHGKGR